jgi:hypothetical protein
LVERDPSKVDVAGSSPVARFRSPPDDGRASIGRNGSEERMTNTFADEPLERLGRRQDRAGTVRPGCPAA